MGGQAGRASEPRVTPRHAPAGSGAAQAPARKRAGFTRGGTGLRLSHQEAAGWAGGGMGGSWHVCQRFPVGPCPFPLGSPAAEETGQRQDAGTGVLRAGRDLFPCLLWPFADRGAPAAHQRTAFDPARKPGPGAGSAVSVCRNADLSRDCGEVARAAPPCRAWRQPWMLWHSMRLAFHPRVPRDSTPRHPATRGRHV